MPHGALLMWRNVWRCARLPCESVWFDYERVVSSFISKSTGSMSSCQLMDGLCVCVCVCVCTQVKIQHQRVPGGKRPHWKNQDNNPPPPHTHTNTHTHTHTHTHACTNTIRAIAVVVVDFFFIMLQYISTSSRRRRAKWTIITQNNDNGRPSRAERENQVWGGGKN